MVHLMFIEDVEDRSSKSFHMLAFLRTVLSS